MEEQFTWEANSNDPQGAENFATISQWWESLGEIAWAQRLIPESGSLSDINWEKQKFDEKLTIENPQVRGITLYWRKSGAEDERNMTPRQLTFDPKNQKLYVYPQSQPQIVIRIANPQLIYQKIELKDPQFVGDKVGENFVFLMRDKKQQLDIKVTLTPMALEQFKSNLPD
ncbi:MAG: hypothetical protein WBG70_00145 [Spirulinaceae cyanobacterium]